jgi:RNA polymerase sigma-70 factor (ECF subfamily)
VVLYYVLDLPVADVSEVMGCRDGTAKTHLDRGRQRLARLLESTDANAEDR